MTTPMHWTPVGPTGQRCGLYTIGKYYVQGSTLYSLHYGDERLAWKDSFEELKEIAEQHRRDRKP